MSEMQEKFKSYVQERLMDIAELKDLAEVLALDSDDVKTLPMVLLKIGGIVSSIDSGMCGADNEKRFNELYLNGSFNEAYSLVKYVFMHYFTAITVKLKGYEKYISRRILVPFRASLADVIYSTLAAFRANGNKEATLKKDDIYFSPMGMLEGDDLCADIYPSSLLYKLNGGTIVYDYKLEYKFIISMRKAVLVKDDFEASCLVDGAKGYGIIEGNMKCLEEYFLDGIIRHDFNLADPKIKELEEELEERYLDIRNNFEEYGSNDNFDDSNLDTTEIC